METQQGNPTNTDKTAEKTQMKQQRRKPIHGIIFPSVKTSKQTRSRSSSDFFLAKTPVNTTSSVRKPLQAVSASANCGSSFTAKKNSDGKCNERMVKKEILEPVVTCRSRNRLSFTSSKKKESPSTKKLHSRLGDASCVDDKSADVGRRKGCSKDSLSKNSRMAEKPLHVPLILRKNRKLDFVVKDIKHCKSHTSAIHKYKAKASTSSTNPTKSSSSSHNTSNEKYQKNCQNLHIVTKMAKPKDNSSVSNDQNSISTPGNDGTCSMCISSEQDEMAATNIDDMSDDDEFSRSVFSQTKIHKVSSNETNLKQEQAEKKSDLCQISESPLLDTHNQNQCQETSNTSKKQELKVYRRSTNCSRKAVQEARISELMTKGKEKTQELMIIHAQNSSSSSSTDDKSIPSTPSDTGSPSSSHDAASSSSQEIKDWMHLFDEPFPRRSPRLSSLPRGKEFECLDNLSPLISYKKSSHRKPETQKPSVKKEPLPEKQTDKCLSKNVSPALLDSSTKKTPASKSSSEKTIKQKEVSLKRHQKNSFDEIFHTKTKKLNVNHNCNARSLQGSPTADSSEEQPLHFPRPSAKLFGPRGPYSVVVDFCLPDKDFCKLKLAKLKRRQTRVTTGQNCKESTQPKKTKMTDNLDIKVEDHKKIVGKNEKIDSLRDSCEEVIDVKEKDSLQDITSPVGTPKTGNNHLNDRDNSCSLSGDITQQFESEGCPSGSILEPLQIPLPASSDQTKQSESEGCLSGSILGPLQIPLPDSLEQTKQSELEGCLSESILGPLQIPIPKSSEQTKQSESENCSSGSILEPLQIPLTEGSEQTKQSESEGCLSGSILGPLNQIPSPKSSEQTKHSESENCPSGSILGPLHIPSPESLEQTKHFETEGCLSGSILGPLHIPSPESLDQTKHSGSEGCLSGSILGPLHIPLPENLEQTKHFESEGCFSGLILGPLQILKAEGSVDTFPNNTGQTKLLNDKQLHIGDLSQKDNLGQVIKGGYKNNSVERSQSSSHLFKNFPFKVSTLVKKNYSPKFTRVSSSQTASLHELTKHSNIEQLDEVQQEKIDETSKSQSPSLKTSVLCCGNRVERKTKPLNQNGVIITEDVAKGKECVPSSQGSLSDSQSPNILKGPLSCNKCKLKNVLSDAHSMPVSPTRCTDASLLPLNMLGDRQGKDTALEGGKSSIEHISESPGICGRENLSMETDEFTTRMQQGCNKDQNDKQVLSEAVPNGTNGELVAECIHSQEESNINKNTCNLARHNNHSLSDVQTYKHQCVSEISPAKSDISVKKLESDYSASSLDQITLNKDLHHHASSSLLIEENDIEMSCDEKENSTLRCIQPLTDKEFAISDSMPLLSNTEEFNNNISCIGDSFPLEDSPCFNGHSFQVCSRNEEFKESTPCLGGSFPSSFNTEEFYIGAQSLEPLLGDTATPLGKARIPESSSKTALISNERENTALTPILMQACLQHDNNDSNTVQSISMSTYEVPGQMTRKTDIIAVCLPHWIVLWMKGKGMEWSVLKFWNSDHVDSELFEKVEFLPVSTHIALFVGGTFAASNARIYGYSENSAYDFQLEYEDMEESVSFNSVCVLNKGSCIGSQSSAIEVVVSGMTTTGPVVTKWTLDCLCLDVNKQQSLATSGETQVITSLYAVTGSNYLLLGTTLSSILLWNHQSCSLLKTISMACLGLPHVHCLQASTEMGLLFLTFSQMASDKVEPDDSGPQCIVCVLNPKNNRLTLLQTLSCQDLQSDAIRCSCASGQYIALGQDNGHTCVWNMGVTHAWTFFPVFQGGIASITFHPNRPIVAFGGRTNGCVHLYSLS